jgi:predicted metal-dependent peptidase
MNASDALSASILHLQTRSPFWATLALFAERRITEAVPTAATDGRRLYFNPNFVATLTQRQLDGLLVHELLHAALLHAARRKGRQPTRWNWAADYVVNAMIMEEDHLELPDGGLHDPAYADRDVEEVYELLKDDSKDDPKPEGGIGRDLLDGPPDEEDESPDGRTSSSGFGKKQEEKDEEKGGLPSCSLNELQEESNGENQTAGSAKQEKDGGEDGDKPPTSGTGKNGGTNDTNLSPHLVQDKESPEALKAHWGNALRQAALLQQMEGKGDLPAGIARIVEGLDKPGLDWRTLLWRYLARTPTDYGDFDRRHIHSGLYLEGMEGERLRVFVCIDTSGSISGESLREFLSEVRGILSGYEHVKVDLYFCDTALAGPHELNSVDDEMPTPEGGGGTDFRPFFEAISEESDPFGESVAVYLTDGWGAFPNEAPSMDVLWVVVPGGLLDDKFPFGQVVRMLG